MEIHDGKMPTGWENDHILVVGLDHFLFSHILEIIIPTDEYFSEGLKPPTRNLFSNWKGFKFPIPGVPTGICYPVQQDGFSSACLTSDTCIINPNQQKPHMT